MGPLLFSVYTEAHNLVLNETKTEMLIFGSNRMAIIENIDFKIVINNQTLTTSTCSKNLGLYLNADLRFSEHVKNVIKKSYGKLKMLYIHKDILSADLKLRLSDTLILLSGLAYCHIVYWPALLSSDKSSLQKIQNSCIRYSFGLRKYDHISDSFRESKWLNLNERFLLQMSCLIFKINKTGTPVYLIN